MNACFYRLLLSCTLLSSCGVLEGGVPGPAGGYVFYDKGAYSDGWRYLECAPEDLGGKDVSWNEAETLCEDYRLGGYDNWDLPSIPELTLMYTNLHKKGMGNFEDGQSEYYWSSDVVRSSSSSRGYLYTFQGGTSSSYDPSYDSSCREYARPVRKF